MRRSIMLLATVSVLAFGAPAQAATFIFSGGNYVPGTTSPTPLLAPDVLNITTAASKNFNAVSFTNQSGSVNWQAGDIFLTSSAAVSNQSLWNITGNNTLGNGGGTISTFTNGGIFRKNAGTGDTTIGGTFNFVNNGTIDAQTGRIVFAAFGGLATFNAGSVFTGAGEVAVNAATAFNGGFTSSNLVFANSTFTGTNAALTGTADWEGGTMAGTWNVNAGSSIDVTTTASKSINAATLTNNGTINWQSGNIFLFSGSALNNNGTIDAQGNDTIGFGGGTPSTFTNNGLIQKSAGSGTTTLAGGAPGLVALDNNGTINVLSGTIALPSAFGNDGTLGGTGTFTSTNLTNNGFIAPGATGATGTLSLTGNYLQSSTGAFNAQLASTGAFDVFNISGTAGLNGALALSCILSCAINSGDSFVLLNSVGNLSGTFSSVTTTGFLSGFTYNVIYDYAADLVRLDVINAGMVTPPPPPPPTGAVPESSTWLMMIFGFGLVGAITRRRNATRAAALV